MNLRRLSISGLSYYRGAHLAVLLGVLAGTAALTGALLVGDAVRGSLRAIGLDRLGRIDAALVTPRFFREEIAAAIAEPATQVCPAIILQGSCVQADTRAFSARVNVFGIDERFASLALDPSSAVHPPAEDRAVVLNAALAEDLHARTGDDVLLRIGKVGAIPADALLGRRDDTTLTFRLRVSAVVPAEGTATFNLNPRQAPPRNAFVPLKTLQRALDQTERVNALLIAAPTTSTDTLAARLSSRLTLADLGLRIRMDEERGYLALESDSFLIAPALEQRLRATATQLDLPSEAVLAYIANRISVDARPERVVPYSTVAALEQPETLRPSLIAPANSTGVALSPGQIILNEWTAEDLDARVGDRIRMEYYVSDNAGVLHTADAVFELTGIAGAHGPAADPGFVPAYHGVTDTRRMTDWDPPFPIDLKLIRDKDEEYWEQHRTTPKAFVTLADGQRLWRAGDAPYGRITSLRLDSKPGDTLAGTGRAFSEAFFHKLDPATVGLRFDPIRKRVQDAGSGSTDFAGLFVGFSFFLILSAALLVALMFRLGMERRAREIGLLAAVGFAPGRIKRILLEEGLLTALLGAALGLLAARAYAWLMIVGLRTWWSDAVNTPFLQPHDTALSYALGYLISLVVAFAAMTWSLRGLTRAAPHALLAGSVQSGRPRAKTRRSAFAGWLALAAAALAIALCALNWHSDAAAQSLAFFLGGTAMLTACLSAASYRMRREPRGVIRRGGLGALARLGIRNARRQPGRSLLTLGLVAAAAFIIAALQSMRLDASREAGEKESGTGGFALRAEAAIPLQYDLNTPDGRRNLGLSPDTEPLLSAARAYPFRLRAGDDASCLNLYRPAQPRVLGAVPAVIDRGGFQFTQTLAQTDEERARPWTLLRRRFDDGAIPAIADEGAVLWQFHSHLGGDLHVVDEQGRAVALRIVGMVKWSILQGEVVVAEENFRRLFPSISGYGFFLIDAPAAESAKLADTLERDLTDNGFSAINTARYLNEMFAVQNTYLTTFQTVGGLGLLLGIVGLTAVMLRNVQERRGELALMRALGYSRAALGFLVLSENALLVAAGMLAGLASAALAILPQLIQNLSRVPWPSLLFTFAVIFLAGMAAGAAALPSALRGRLIEALRSE